MARPLRIEFEGAFYHVMNRGVERRKIFMDEKDFVWFLKFFHQAHQKYQVVLHAYCLMPNHYHLYVETPKADLQRALRHLNGVYTQYFNRRHERVGPLLQGRYKSVLVDKENYSLELARYIHLNPVKSGLVEKPWQYRWSSFPAYLGKVKSPEYLNTGWILSQMGSRTSKARKELNDFTLAGLGKKWEPREEAVGGGLLGSSEFIRGIREKHLRERSDKEISGLRQVHKPYEVERVEAWLNQLEMDEKRRRKLMIYGLKKYTRLKLKEIGERAGGMKEVAVSQTVRRLENERMKDKELGRRMAELDQWICKM